MIPFLALAGALALLAIIAPSGNNAENNQETDDMSKKLRKKLEGREHDAPKDELVELPEDELDELDEVHEDELDAKIDELEKGEKAPLVD